MRFGTSSNEATKAVDIITRHGPLAIMVGLLSTLILAPSRASDTIPWRRAEGAKLKLFNRGTAFAQLLGRGKS
ncbi:hypothetical protein [Ruegeria sp. Ofav3-42]|uniref:hypothetical protein n=1 Tax=Ruegeria sp. Ofav3-42 TaxID=2917759 RepID=UPI001EF3EFBD|nr:hypothetical protein [Ruegeria sp. Ofav3-42]MCG7521486.1 hypothetical protein [Ruegeria sp. Ofav3-42]